MYYCFKLLEFGGIDDYSRQHDGPKDNFTSSGSEPVNVISYGRDSADVIKDLRLGKREDYLGLSRWALNGVTNLSVREKQREIWHA